MTGAENLLTEISENTKGTLLILSFLFFARYKIGDGFRNEISSAVLDFTGDDEGNMRSLNNSRRW